MGHCRSAFKEPDQLDDERSCSETYHSSTAHHIEVTTPSSSDTPVESVKYESECVVGQSKKENQKLKKKEQVFGDESTPEVISMYTKPKIYNKFGKTTGLVFDKTHLSSPVMGSYSAKKGLKDSTAEQPTMMSLPCRMSRCSQVFLRKNTTNISDWGDMYDGITIPNINVSDHFRSLFSLELSEPVTSGDILSSHSSIEKTKLTKLQGHVLGMLLIKEGFHFRLLNFNWTMKEVVDKFLVKECGARLPLSFSTNQLHRPKMLSNDWMQMTLVENLGSQFDVKTHGLLFATGYVESKLCYKMTKCERCEIEKMFSQSAHFQKAKPLQ